ncbi:MAG: hypothetical protein ACHQ4F_15445 [Candidatus Dormibacteria bacterium]
MIVAGRWAWALLVGALVVAASLGFTYITGWRILWGGVQGGDGLWHLHLATWVSETWPSLPWWYRWDVSGVPYRSIYPLLPHWIAVASARGLGLDVAGGLQVVQFLLQPVCAAGVYLFFALRIRRPIAGFAAAVLYLISPFAWAYFIDFGLYANVMGTAFFMPAVIAIDWFFWTWLSGDRGWRFRVAAALAVGSSALMGIVSPEIFPAPLLVIVAYGFAASRRRGTVSEPHPAPFFGHPGSRRRWWMAAVPMLVLGTLALELIWILPSVDFLVVTGARSPSAGFTLSSLSLLNLPSLLQLGPLGYRSAADRLSLSPAVTLPALVGVVWAWRDGRARVFAVLAGAGLLFMTQAWIEAPLSIVPSAQLFLEVVKRPMAVLLEFAVPILAGAGMYAAAQGLIGWAAGRLARGRAVRPAKAAARVLGALVATLLLGTGVAVFATRSAGESNWLAYGPSAGQTAADLRDIWARHLNDICAPDVPRRSPACESALLTSKYSVAELAAACTGGGSKAPVCSAAVWHGGVWSSGDDALVSTTDAWCSSGNAADPACAAQFAPLWQQIVDAAYWRPVQVGCFTPDCVRRAQVLASLQSVFPTPPERAELNSDFFQYNMAFRELTGGGSQAETYASQALPSRSLYSFMEDTMLGSGSRAIAAKKELASALGIDAVALAPSQASAGDAYRAMGWEQVLGGPDTSGASAQAFVNPAPTGIASEWPGGRAVLVVGASQTSASDVYNTVFKLAVGGVLPSASAWLVRGSSPYIDDYPISELRNYSMIVLLGYRYHDRSAAWSTVDQYVTAGGAAYVETGWQYVNPDWDGGGGAAPAALPVSQLSWGPLDPSALVTVDGVPAAGWGGMTYGTGAWGASSAAVSGVRGSAVGVVRVGSRVVAAGWIRGRGRLFWSGMNLAAHAVSKGSDAELQFLADRFAWALDLNRADLASTDPATAGQGRLSPSWPNDEQAVLPLQPSTGPTWVLFRESDFPEWSASVIDASGRRQQVAIVPSEMDYMLVRLDQVTAGSRLQFDYSPSVWMWAPWLSSAGLVLMLVIWCLRPAWFAATREALTDKLGAALRRGNDILAKRIAWDEE